MSSSSQTFANFLFQSTFWGRNMILFLEASFSAFTSNIVVPCTHSVKGNLEKMLLKSKKTAGVTNNVKDGLIPINVQVSNGSE